ncbi:MAG: hypothetical protein ACR2IE_12745 [Candidatus Sumerlaeaceae bacterium]
MKYVARISVLERHPDGTSRQFLATQVVDDHTTVRDLMQWREMKVHDPINGEYASREIILTPNDADID